MTTTQLTKTTQGWQLSWTDDHGRMISLPFDRAEEAEIFALHNGITFERK